MPESASTSSHSCDAAKPAPVPGAISSLGDGALRGQHRRDALRETSPRSPGAQRGEAALRSDCWATTAEAGLVAERGGETAVPHQKVPWPTTKVPRPGTTRLPPAVGRARASWLAPRRGAWARA